MDGIGLNPCVKVLIGALAGFEGVDFGAGWVRENRVEGGETRQAVIVAVLRVSMSARRQLSLKGMVE